MRAKLMAWLTAALVLGACVTADADAATLRITADEWCPYNCTPDSEKPGYVVEMAREIYGRQGHDVEYVKRPWSRALQAVARGKLDAAIAVTTEPESAKMIKPEEPIGYYEVAFFTRAESDWTYDGVKSLQGKRLAAIQDYAYLPEIDSYIENNADTAAVMVDPTPLELNLRQVKMGRADVTLDDRAVAAYEISNMNAGDAFRMAGTAGEPVPLYLAFSKKIENADTWARRWSEGVRELRASGKLDDILSSYGISDWADKQ